MTLFSAIKNNLLYKKLTSKKGLASWLIKRRKFILNYFNESLKKAFIEFNSIPESIKTKEELLNKLKRNEINILEFSEKINKIIKESIDKGVNLIKELDKEINSKDNPEPIIYEFEDIKLELTREYLFVRMKELFDKELKLIKHFNLSKVNDFEQLINKEKNLLQKANFILNKKFAETHAHSVATVPLPWHWKAFKMYGVNIPWDYVVNEKWDELKEQGYSYFFIKKLRRIPRKIAKKLKYIADGLKKGRPESILRKYFEIAIILDYNKENNFKAFQEKVGILGFLSYLVFKNAWRRDVFTKMMIETAKNQIKHGVTYLEFRSGITHHGESFEDMEKELLFLLNSAKIAEEEVNKLTKKSIKIRILPAMYHDKNYIPIVNLFLKLVFDIKKNNPLGKYIGGIDYYEIGYIKDGKYFNQSFYIPKKVFRFNQHTNKKLFLTVHIGELFAPKNFSGFSEKNPRDFYKTFFYSLKSVEDVINFSIEHDLVIKRLGHANVLGVDVNDYFKSIKKELNCNLNEIASEEELRNLKETQKRILYKIRKNKIAIESNPTSNVKITDINDYEKHPLRKFIFEDVAVSVNTDDALTFMTHLKDELLIMADRLNLDKKKIKQIIRNGFKSAFE